MTVIHQDETPATPHPIDMLERAQSSLDASLRTTSSLRQAAE